MLADAAPLLVGMLADAGAPAVLALALLVVMPADAGAPAVLERSPVAVMLTDAGRCWCPSSPCTCSSLAVVLTPPCGAHFH